MTARAATSAVVDGQAVTVRDAADLLGRIEPLLAAGRGFTLFTLNLDHLVKRRQSAAFRAIYGRATFVTADGWPVARLARTAMPGIRRTTGADLVVPLCRLAASMGRPVALFGSSEAVLAAASARLREMAPGLAIACVAAPPPGFDPSGIEASAAIAGIAASGAAICFVALGAPKQEFFCDAAHRQAPSIGFAAIGASLDFLAGATRRAPTVVRRFNLEWAWRFALQPGRLGPRYLRCALLYARLLVAGNSGRAVP